MVSLLVTLMLLLYVPGTEHWAVLAVHSMYCRTGISTGTYNRNFRVINNHPINIIETLEEITFCIYHTYYTVAIDILS